MGIEFRSGIDFKKIARELKAEHKKALGAALEDEATAIVERTQKGLDYTGKPFSGYEDAYKKAKQFATGRGSKVDLLGFRYKRRDGETSKSKKTSAGGDMLRAITTFIREVGNDLIGTINFGGNALQTAKARGNMENSKKRIFFKLSDKQVTRIKNKLKKAFG